jgi:predicted nucleic acid-binding protein
VVRYLLDTCAVSELQKMNPHPRVVERIKGMKPNDVFLSVITLAELDRGILMLPEGRKRRELEHWSEAVQGEFANSVLDVDREVARLWAELSVRVHRSGGALSLGDGLIAATATRHGLHLVTRNTKDFVATGVLILNPWNE